MNHDSLTYRRDSSTACFSRGSRHPGARPSWLWFAACLFLASCGLTIEQRNAVRSFGKAARDFG
jgi:hypothetical protein